MSLGSEAKCGWEGAGFQSKPMILIEGGNRRIWDTGDLHASDVGFLRAGVTAEGKILPFSHTGFIQLGLATVCSCCSGFLDSACCSVRGLKPFNGGPSHSLWLPSGDRRIDSKKKKLRNMDHTTSKY